ncbi:hypothetical protein ACJ72_06375 [Emergomyces africanus]|uniref:Uncharacterized protein n=1 Tax=Emergomyces africanus TaxID=1955775 RepID=A0A1B7NR88_9EURO|nr:hypothetical protein ACJ72_06375 [Emergomyces africanus]
MEPDKDKPGNSTHDLGDQSRGVDQGEQVGPSTRYLKRACKDEHPSEPAKKPRAGSKLALKSKLQDASEKIESLENKCFVLKRENSSLKERHNEFQKEVLGLRGARGLERMDDNDVRNMFDDLVDRYRNWAREYSRRGPVDFDALAVHQDVYMKGEGMMYTALSGRLAAVETSVYGKFIFLHTLLAHFSCWSIIDHPLFFLKQKVPESRSEKIQELFSDLMEAVPRHRKDEWVGSTLRMLFPNGKDKDDFQTTIVEYNRILSHTTNFYEQSARRFLAIAVPLFKPLSEGQSNDRLRSLVNILATTGDLVLKLRKQNYDIKFLSHESTTLHDQGFSRESRIMEPHSAMRLRPDDSSLDGSEIDFVIQPAIVASWFDEDSKETREKVWAKAVVWASKLEQACAKGTDSGNHVGVSNGKRETGCTQKDMNNLAVGLFTPTRHLNGVNDPLLPPSEQNMSLPPGINNFEAPSVAATDYSNGFPHTLANHLAGLDAPAASVETNQDPPRLSPNWLSGETNGDAMGHSSNMIKGFHSRFGRKIRPTFNNTKHWAESSQSATENNDSDLDYALPGHNESDDELGELGPLRQRNTRKKTRGESYESQFPKRRFQGYMAEPTCIYGFPGPTNSLGGAHLESFSVYPDPSGSTPRKEPQYVNDYVHFAHPRQTAPAPLPPLQRTHTPHWSYEADNAPHANPYAHSAGRVRKANEYFVNQENVR